MKNNWNKMHIHNLQSVLNKVMMPQMSIIKNIVIQKYCLWGNQNTSLSNARVNLNFHRWSDRPFGPPVDSSRQHPRVWQNRQTTTHARLEKHGRSVPASGWWYCGWNWAHHHRSDLQETPDPQPTQTQNCTTCSSQVAWNGAGEVSTWPENLAKNIACKLITNKVTWSFLIKQRQHSYLNNTCRTECKILMLITRPDCCKTTVV